MYDPLNVALLIGLFVGLACLFAVVLRVTLNKALGIKDDGSQVVEEPWMPASLVRRQLIRRCLVEQLATPPVPAVVLNDDCYNCSGSGCWCCDY